MATRVLGLILVLAGSITLVAGGPRGVAAAEAGDMWGGYPTDVGGRRTTSVSTPRTASVPPRLASRWQTRRVRPRW